jgi:hypothetical protein
VGRNREAPTDDVTDAVVERVTLSVALVTTVPSFCGFLRLMGLATTGHDHAYDVVGFSGWHGPRSTSRGLSRGCLDRTGQDCRMERYSCGVCGGGEEEGRQRLSRTGCLERNLVRLSGVRGRVTAEALDMMAFQLEMAIGDRQSPWLQFSPGRSRIHLFRGEKDGPLVLVALHTGAVRAEAP